jgi:ribonuclease R
MEADREVVDMYRAFLMRDRIGEEYDGAIVGVSSFGVFVEVDAPFVEGLIRTERLGEDQWDFEEEHVRLVGRLTGRSFALGDSVRVRVENVSVQRRKIDFVLVEHAERTPRTPEKMHARSPRKPEKKHDRSIRTEPRGRGRGAGDGRGRRR